MNSACYAHHPCVGIGEMFCLYVQLLINTPKCHSADTCWVMVDSCWSRNCCCWSVACSCCPRFVCCWSVICCLWSKDMCFSFKSRNICPQVMRSYKRTSLSSEARSKRSIFNKAITRQKSYCVGVIPVTLCDIRSYNIKYST